MYWHRDPLVLDQKKIRKMSMFKRRNRRVRRLAALEVSLTPLIDVALTLLVIFMIAAPVATYGIKVNLPHSKSKEINDRQELLITMAKDGSLYFNNMLIEKELLISTVQQALGDQYNKPVFVSADEFIFYGKVIHMVAKLERAGVRVVALSTQK